MIELSVLICTHNPRTDYLRRVLDSLRQQTLSRQSWELILIDNASKERVSESWDISWHNQGRHVREEETGLTVARLRAIRESKGSLLVFVDDDNILAPDFLQEAQILSNERPYLGVFGAGKLEPEFETAPPAYLTPHLPRLALRTVEQTLWSNNIKDFECIPWGAGLCVSRTVAEYYMQLIQELNITSLLGRRGKHLFCGEDDVFSWAAVALGLGFGLFPDLRITHLISAARLDEKYFLRLIEGHSFSHGVLNFLRSGVLRCPSRAWEYLLSVFHGLRRGTFSMRCRWASMRGHNLAKQFVRERRLNKITLGLPQYGKPSFQK
jgi:glycosyltransferase involved in cell wall biosynthesis